MNLTCRSEFKHIEEKIISSIVAVKAYLDLVKDVPNQIYVPNGNGSVQHFQDMKSDQLSAAIVKGGLIDDLFIIICSPNTFPESGHEKGKMRTIGEEWATISTAYENAHGTVVHLETQFKRFQNFYNKRLKELYDKRKGNQQQAHHV